MLYKCFVFTEAHFSPTITELPLFRNTEHLYNIYTTSAQRGRRWADVVNVIRCINVIQMFCVCWVISVWMFLFFIFRCSGVSGHSEQHHLPPPHTAGGITLTYTGSLSSSSTFSSTISLTPSAPICRDARFCIIVIYMYTFDRRNTSPCVFYTHDKRSFTHECGTF